MSKNNHANRTSNNYIDSESNYLSRNEDKEIKFMSLLENKGNNNLNTHKTISVIGGDNNYFNKEINHFKSQIKEKTNDDISLSLNSAWNNTQCKNQALFATDKKKNLAKIFTRETEKIKEKHFINQQYNKDDLIIEKDEMIENDLNDLAHLKVELENCVIWEKYDILINCNKFTNQLKKCFRFLEDYPDVFLLKLKAKLKNIFPSKFLPLKRTQFRSLMKNKSQNKGVSKMNKFAETNRKDDFSQLKEEENTNNNKEIKTKHLNHFKKMKIRIYNFDFNPDNNYLNKDIDQFLTLEGFVIYLSPQKVLVQSMKFKCTQCGLNTKIFFEKFKIIYPEKCEGCFNTQFFPLKTTSEMVLMQRAKIQQTENKIVMLELKGNFVNSIEIGDEVIVSGILRSEILNKDEFLGKQQNKTGGLFIYFIEVNSLLKKKEKFFLEKNQQENKSSISQLMTSQMYMNTDDNQECPKIYDKALYYINYTPEEMYLFKDISESDLMFETLIAFFYPKLKSSDSYLLKSFLVLSLVLQEDPLNLLIIGNMGSHKTELLCFASEIAHKNVPNLNFNLFPTLERISGFEKSINPGILALGNDGVCVFDNIEKLKKNETEKLIYVIEDRKVNVPKINDKSTLKSNTTILAGVDCYEEINHNFEYIKQSLKLSKKFVDAFDFILIAKKPPEKYIKNLSNKLFYQSQIKSQILQSDEIEKNGFSLYIENVIKKKDILKRFHKLEEKAIYKKLQIYIQNTSKPILTPEIASYLKEYYFNVKEIFALKNGEINPKFFISLIKLVFARTILNNKTTITIQICDEIIQMMNEYFFGLYPNGGEREKNQINKNGKLNKNLSKKNKEQLFIETLKELSFKNNRYIYCMEDFKEIEESLDLQIDDFELFINKMNYNALLLKKNSKEFQFIKN